MKLGLKSYDQDLESRLGTTLVTEATMLQRWFLFLKVVFIEIFQGGNPQPLPILRCFFLHPWQVHKSVGDCSQNTFLAGKMFDPALWRESCPIGDCPWACGVRFHMCKVFNNCHRHHDFCRQMTMPPSAQITGHLMRWTGFAALEDLARLPKWRRRRRALHKRRRSTV